jgi:hypothetical protein
MKPGYYTKSDKRGWCVVLWNGERVVSTKFVGEIGTKRTNFFDKAMKLADERNRQKGFNVGINGVYNPNIEFPKENPKLDHFLIGPQSDENIPLEMI